eukprot:3584486-Heterocapsa_arctica.AAC.1
MRSQCSRPCGCPQSTRSQDARGEELGSACLLDVCAQGSRPRRCTRYHATEMFAEKSSKLPVSLRYALTMFTTSAMALFILQSRRSRRRTRRCQSP